MQLFPCSFLHEASRKRPCETRIHSNVGLFVRFSALRGLQHPALAKMAKQYLAAPASSAGVERVFSAASKMHDDLRKSAKDHSLKHALFAAFNTK